VSNVEKKTFPVRARNLNMTIWNVQTATNIWATSQDMKQEQNRNKILINIQM
jgi:hypothetical protein